LAAACAAPREEAPPVPVKFLQTTVPAWKRILAAEVSADFHATPLRDALMFISMRSDANLTVKFDTENPPTITRKLERVPFRTALYLLAHDSGATVTWELTPDGFQRGIIFAAK
jgi:hypothetical protein